MGVSLPVEVVVMGDPKQVHDMHCVVREVFEVGVEVVLQLTGATEVQHRTEVLIQFSAGRESRKRKAGHKGVNHAEDGEEGGWWRGVTG